jgi:hypothetical protein
MFRTTRWLTVLATIAVLGAVCHGKDRVPDTMRFQTGGYGVFFPANLGKGDPNKYPQVIGDGSGYSAYDGTPTGNEFKLDGVLVGDGWDRHFGAAQTFGPGIIVNSDVTLYPYKTTNNPIRPARKIHIMKTRVGEVWFQYGGFFTLDTSEGTLVSRSDFRIVGGTGMFVGATGDVFVVTQTDLADITADGAPFRYDFNGWIQLRH